MTSEIIKTSELKTKVSKILLRDCVQLNFENQFIFSSGLKSPIKIDFEKINLHPYDFNIIITEMEKLISNNYLDFDFLGGVIKGGALLAQCMSRKIKKPAVARLGKKQDEERKELVSGQIKWGMRGLIIEDILTTGLNSTFATEQIRAEGAHVRELLVVLDYGFRIARDNLVDCGLRFWSLTDFKTLLEVGKDFETFKDSEVKQLQDWWATTNLQNLSTPA